MLAFSPFEDETSQDAQHHFDFLSVVLDIFNKSWINVTALIGDNCSTNHALANKAKVGFIGCSSHRFNIAVQDILQSHAAIIAKIHVIMKS